MCLGACVLLQSITTKLPLCTFFPIYLFQRCSVPLVNLSNFIAVVPTAVAAHNCLMPSSNKSCVAANGKLPNAMCMCNAMFLSYVFWVTMFLNGFSAVWLYL